MSDEEEGLLEDLNLFADTVSDGGPNQREVKSDITPQQLEGEATYLNSPANPNSFAYISANRSGDGSVLSKSHSN